MKGWPFKKVVGFTLLLLGLILILAVFVYPYSKLWGKQNVEFDSPVKIELSRDRPVLPVFSGLKMNPTKSPNQAFLTVEKLGIKKAPIRLNILVDNLRPDYLNALLTGLAHLKGTAYPGQRGNSVIFGHSALPYLYNPGDFQTIFTRLDELKFGDLILVETDSETLKYRVEKVGLLDERATLSDLFSVKPRLTLLTCYPPGFKTRRYVVRALLEE